MKKPIIILKTLFLFGGSMSFGETLANVRGSKGSVYKQTDNWGDYLVKTEEGEGHRAKVSVGVTINIVEATRHHYTYENNKENSQGILRVEVDNPKNAEIYVEYEDSRGRVIEEGIKEADTAGFKEKEAKITARENYHAKLSHPDVHHDKKGRLIVVTKYR